MARIGGAFKRALLGGLAVLVLLGVLVAVVGPWNRHHVAWAGKPSADGTRASIHEIRMW